MRLRELDGCQVCRGRRGGAPGNENIIDGTVMCDYCFAETLRFKRGVYEPDAPIQSQAPAAAQEARAAGAGQRGQHAAPRAMKTHVRLVLVAALLLAGVDLAVHYPSLPWGQRLPHDLAQLLFGAAVWAAVNKGRSS